MQRTAIRQAVLGGMAALALSALIGVPLRAPSEDHIAATVQITDRAPTPVEVARMKEDPKVTKELSPPA